GLNKFTGFCIKFKGKRAISIHIISDDNKIALSTKVLPANVHDVVPLLDLVNDSKVDLQGKYHQPTYLGADKAYTSEKRYKVLKEQNIILTCPLKIYNKKKTN